jgi:hypothetical protein
MNTLEPSDYLTFDRVFHVHRSDIYYVRKARHLEVVPVEGDIGLFEPVNPQAGVIVFADRRKRRFITEMQVYDLVRGALPFVDLGGGRYVPAANIREICEAPSGSREQGTEIWLHGRPYAICLMSQVPKDVMEARWEAAMAKLPDAPIPGGIAVRLPRDPQSLRERGKRPSQKLAA